MGAELEKVAADVVRYGWHVLKVLPTSESQGWAFTVGLARSYGHAEILMCGLEGDTAHVLLNDLGSRVSRGARFEAEASDTALLEGLTCRFRRVQPVWYEWFLGTAVRYYGGSDFDVVQCFWPDREDRAPWEDGFASGLLPRQPLLYLESAEEGRVEHWLDR